MKLTINGVEQAESELKGETLEAILDMMVKNAPGSYIRRIWLDQQEFPADDRETLQKKPTDINSLEVELANLKDLVATNLSNALDYLEKLIPGFDQAADLFRMGNEQEANKFYIQILDGMDWFSEVINIVMDSEFKRSAPEDTLRLRQAKLTDLMSQMLEANKNQDWVLLADILEYEMIPFYKEWQTILTRIKNPQ
jgi:hypothetical protein